MMNIPDEGRGRKKQEIQSVYRGRKGIGEDYSMHKKKGLTKELQLSDLSQSGKSGLQFRIFA